MYDSNSKGVPVRSRARFLSTFFKIQQSLGNMVKKKPKRHTSPKNPDAQKANRPNAEARLLKALDNTKLAAPLGPMVTSAKVFQPFKEIVRAYLEANRYSDTSRNLVSNLAFHFRQEAFRRFKHDTAETFQLAELIRPQTVVVERTVSLGATAHIMQNPNVKMRLDVEEEAAADMIVKIWAAFGKGLSGGSRDFSRIGGSGQILHPLDTMDEDLWLHYKQVYKPWYNIAARLAVSRKEAGTSLSVAAIVFLILVQDSYPEKIDTNYAMKKGTTLVALKAALACYWKPEGLKARLAPPKASAQPASKAELASSSEPLALASQSPKA